MNLVIKNNLKKLNKNLVLVKYVDYPEYNEKKEKEIVINSFIDGMKEKE